MSPDMLTSCRMFERFYLSRHNGRRLSWQPSLGNADIKVTFKNKKHDLNVSTYALVILVLFETLAPEEVLTYDVRVQTPRFLCAESLINILLASGAQRGDVYS